MHGQPSGLEMIAALASDHVLRYNVRIIMKSKDFQPSPFIRSAFGSHHLRLQNDIAHRWNAIFDQLSPVDRQGLIHLPVLEDVASNEAFGLVPSQHVATFGGLYTVKEEPDDEDQLARLSSQDPDAHESALRQLNIDPYLAHVPARQLHPKPELADTTASGTPADLHVEVTAIAAPHEDLQQAQGEPLEAVAFHAAAEEERDSSPELEILSNETLSANALGKRRANTLLDDGNLTLKKPRTVVQSAGGVSADISDKNWTQTHINLIECSWPCAAPVLWFSAQDTARPRLCERRLCTRRISASCSKSGRGYNCALCTSAEHLLNQRRRQQSSGALFWCPNIHTRVCCSLDT